MDLCKVRDVILRQWHLWHTWWREPHYLGKCAIIGGALYALGAVADAPDEPLTFIGCLLGLGVIVLLPRWPHWAIPVGLALCFASSFQYVQSQTQLCGIVTIVVMFLASGYAMPTWFAVGAPLVYALLDAAGAIWLGAHGAGMRMLRDFLDFYADSGGSVADYSHYPVALGVSNIVFDVIFFGFYSVMGFAFRAGNAKSQRLERAEAMLARVTREQELAHMIHDSVANDASTIALLAWRAKSVESRDERNAMLDAIYRCSHDALDRVHEVIDVLNGKRSLQQVATIAGVGEQGNAVALDAQMERYMENQNRVLGMLGIAGTSRIEGALPDNAVISPALRGAVMGLLREIYANIVRHCDAGDDEMATPAYTLMVSIAPHAVRIVQTNPITGQPKALFGAGHGKGLALHRAAIESLGGTLFAGARNGVWTLSADIPLS